MTGNLFRVLPVLLSIACVTPAEADPFVDDFTRPDASNLGPDWTGGDGGFRIESGLARSSRDDGPDLITASGFDSESPVVSMDVIYSGDARLVYAAAVSLYQGLDDNIFVKVQDANRNGDFERVYFYYGNNGSAWPEMTGGASVVNVAPFTSANITTIISGDTVTLEIDRDFNGEPEDVLSRGGIPLTGLGTGVGMGGFGDAAVDHFLAMTAVLGIPGDTNADDLVNIDDLNNVRNNFGAEGPDDGSLAGDAFPFDGLVNIDDLNGVRNNFGAGAAAVPEPASLVLASLLAFSWASAGRRLIGIDPCRRD